MTCPPDWNLGGDRVWALVPGAVSWSPPIARTLLTLALNPTGTNHFYCQSILGLCSRGNKSFFQRSLFNLAKDCVCGGGAYINALFLTCLVLFRLALNEYLENKGLWLFRSITSCRAWFLSLLNLILDSSCCPSPSREHVKKIKSVSEGEAHIPLYVLIRWFPQGVWREAFLHIYAFNTAEVVGPGRAVLLLWVFRSLAALVVVSTDNDCITKWVLVTLNILKTETEGNVIDSEC